uniref:NADH-ubiquinone oxidoreductase chain 5 n=1 Tax=Cyrtotrachelus buqueti TaxID=1892066 RepID=A0A346T606_9CUCU|nr:NADH dehydrogenase subunit 5 [Cyrtotrachelus buqueti]AXU05689.1 NADH dehydrogenase subunit 5 [Cyrtotrachelus buqueti]
MMVFKSYFFILLFMSVNLFITGLYFVSLNAVHSMEYNLLSFNSVSMVYGITIDWMSLSFMSFVLFISAAVVKYSEEYMGEDFNKGRFIYLVILFVVSMMFMIISPNLVSILLGWDGLGLVSYALVIYYQNVKSFNAGMLTALTNRLGDVAILMCIAVIFNFGTWNFLSLLELLKKDLFFQVCTAFIIIASTTKSAQVPFSSWLPAAMAAPTPVSALVHSSTLVTAGVYLLIRFNESIPDSYMTILMYVSLVTMFMSGYAANFEYDLKKIIALSTLSQLGMMIFILTEGSSDLAFFHLLMHALFKALLFLCAGMIIHNFSDCQDVRQMGSLAKTMPLTCVYFNICNLSLCGLPFLSGFYFKDLIAEALSMDSQNLSIYCFFFYSVGLTVSYSFRLLYYSMSGTFSGISINNLNESSKGMLTSMGLLIFLVIFMGASTMWISFPTPSFTLLPADMKLMTLYMIMAGAWVGYSVTQMAYLWSKKADIFRNVSMFLANMWNLPIFSSLLTSKWFLYLSKQYNKIVDQGWLEFYGSQKFHKILSYYSKFTQLFSKNFFKIYIVLTIIWLSYAIMFMN